MKEGQIGNGLEMPVRVIVPTGALGAGIDAANVRRGIEMGACAIACDAGSTDSGPSYLYRGVAKVSREAVKSDLAILMLACREAGIPLLVGSCGTSGGDIAVDWAVEIAEEVAHEMDWKPRIAALYSEQSPDVLKAKNGAGRISPLAPLGPLDNATIDECAHIVALMGVEPYIAALEAGADIVLGGRTTDTAVLAAVPIMRGANVSASWHAAKTAECGSLCSVNPRGGGVIMSVDATGFEIEPLALDNACTPHTVSAHMLYENSDPFHLYEPGGMLDVSDARYVPVDSRATRVEGSRWTPGPYTMKLEGASGGRYQTIMLIGIADPLVLKSLNKFEQNLRATLYNRVAATIGLTEHEFSISLRIYGWNAVLGDNVPDDTAAPREVGVMFVATAETQEMATRIAKTCNPLFFHFPLEAGIELPSYGYPFSPAEIERGQVFEFRLNHIVGVDDPLELVRTRWINAGSSVRIKELANG